MATTKKRYSDTTVQRYRNRNLEPEPGTVHNLCKLEHFAPQEIYIIIIYRGGAQLNNNIQYYMQGILIFKGKWQYIFLFSHLKEHLKPYIKLFYRFFISFLLLQIF
jgi:hypothetical protein